MPISRLQRLFFKSSLLTLLILLSGGCVQPPQVSTSSSETIQVAPLPTVPIPTLNCAQADGEQLASELAAANQVLISTIAEQYAATKEGDLARFAERYNAAARYRLKLFPGNGQVVLALVEPVTCSHWVTSHPPTLWEAYVLSHTGEFWALDTIGGLDSKDVYWDNNGWVIIPELNGNPNPYNRRYAVWHVTEQQGEWQKAAFRLELEYLNLLPEPKRLAAVTKPEWNAAASTVRSQFTVVTADLACALVPDPTQYYQQWQDLETRHQWQAGQYVQTQVNVRETRLQNSPLPIGIATLCQ